ncbi:MAG: amidase [Proteobacteria bacterium]|nr:amidase [Pseudomonadota bacterium]
MLDPFRATDISTLHEWIARGEIRASELSEWTIARSKDLDPHYHFWVCHDPDNLRDQARLSQARVTEGQTLRPLEAMPVGVKDIFNTHDYPTQMGSPLWKDFRPGNDARVVYSLRNAGGLVAGKTVTAEFAVHAEPETINPHNPALTPGTSSSGSAVAVALGVVPVALGTQTGASITRPASFCGIYGFKPSFGLLPRTGILKTTDSLDTVGFFSSRYGNLRRVFNVLRVQGMNYPLSHKALMDQERQSPTPGRPFKILLARTHTWDQATEEARSQLLAYAHELSASGAVEIFEDPLPGSLEQCHILHSIIYDKSLSYYFKDESRQEMLISPAIREMLAHGSSVGVSDFHAAVARQEQLCASVDAFLTKYDAVLSLSTAGPAPLRDTYPPADPGLMWTMLHLPSISVPRFATKEGLPIGVQFSARRFNDFLLLGVLDTLRALDLVPAGSFPVAHPIV